MHGSYAQDKQYSFKTVCPQIKSWTLERTFHDFFKNLADRPKCTWIMLHKNMFSYPVAVTFLCRDPGVNGSNQPNLSNFNFVVELVTQNAGAVLQYVEVPILVHQSWTQIAGCWDFYFFHHNAWDVEMVLGPCCMAKKVGSINELMRTFFPTHHFGCESQVRCPDGSWPTKWNLIPVMTWSYFYGQVSRISSWAQQLTHFAWSLRHTVVRMHH